MIAKSSVNEGSTIPQGNFKSVVVGVFYDGTVMKLPYGGKPGDPLEESSELILMYEIHARGEAIGTVPDWMTLTFGDRSTLRKRAEAILNKQLPKHADFDPRELLGKACRVQIEHKSGGDRVRERVATVTALGEDDVPPTPKSPLLSLDVDEPGLVIDERIPQWIQVRAARSPEFAKNYRPAPAAGATPKPARSVSEKDFDSLLTS